MGKKKNKKILELYFLVVKSLFKPSNKYVRIMSVDVALTQWASLVRKASIGRLY